MKAIKCKCDGIFKESVTEFEGFDVEALKCSKCGELTFTPSQFKKVLALKELANEIKSKRKVVKIGNSIGVLLPKAVEKIGIKIGQSVNINLGNKKEIKIAVA